MVNKLNNREAYHLAQILAKEEMANSFIQYFQGQLQVLALEKQTILKAYGLPADFGYDENTQEVIIEDDKNKE